MNKGQTAFIKVTDLAERARLFRDLCNTPCEVIAKAHDPSAEITLLQAKICTGADISFRPLDPHYYFAPAGDLILQMTIGGEKYLCSSPFHFRDGMLYVKTTVALFHLQRREDYRQKIPAGFQAQFDIKMINTDVFNKTFRILDLSGGGCRLSDSNNLTAFSVGDKVSGEIVLKDRPRILISGVVRHQIKDEIKKQQSLGIMFTDVSAPMKNRISALVMDLYRQLFSKLT